MRISVLALGKKGRLYLRFLLSTILIAAVIYSYTVLASTPVTSPAIVNNNVTTINGVTIASYGSEVL